jgi:hypothetical protein
MARCFALPLLCRDDDKAADEKCRAVDEVVPLERRRDDALQRLSMLPNTAEQKAYPARTVIYGAWCTQHIKKERRPGFAQLNERRSDYIKTPTCDLDRAWRPVQIHS